ncbi:hypothetical protein EYC98_08355 [Halieaceae bacterium IMCC14734]|uniref:Dockerin domain-containing protein n=1 Tax=Candidatus Litorirhabdus singularis TaxID=2518993 RepID=A0ABT3TEZ1_9GAMM|nr:hypothetical protein [Candidatus Litorirhabdus singularis]MCX2980876.1 hypothetical protein [Candidatus Litorirhabdus singularis]
MASMTVSAAPLNFQSFFTAQDTVTLSGLNSSRALLVEDSAIAFVALENDPSLGDEKIILPAANMELRFDYVFKEAPGGDDIFLVVLFETAEGPVNGLLESFEASASSMGTQRFALGNYTGRELGLTFLLREQAGVNETLGSSVTISGLRVESNTLDTDQDGVVDIEDNCVEISNNNQLNTDLDGLGNLCDDDDDNDGLTDVEEAHYGTNPLLVDTDNDGYTDGVEVGAGTNPLRDTSYPGAATGDLDDDGKVTIADVLVGLRVLSGAVSLTQEHLDRGDVAPLQNGSPVPDGRFDLGDVLVIQKKVLGLEGF